MCPGQPGEKTRTVYFGYLGFVNSFDREFVEVVPRTIITDKEGCGVIPRRNWLGDMPAVLK